jgi:hypothetical protein
VNAIVIDRWDKEKAAFSAASQPGGHVR